jgi:hypothetical protein
LIGRAMSTSYIPKEGEIYNRFSIDLQKLYNKYCDRDGLVKLKYKTSVYWTDLC